MNERPPLPHEPGAVRPPELRGPGRGRDSSPAVACLIYSSYPCIFCYTFNPHLFGLIFKFFSPTTVLVFCLKASQTNGEKTQSAFPSPKPSRGCSGSLSCQLDIANTVWLQNICINPRGGFPLERASHRSGLPFFSSCHRILQNTKNETSVLSLKKKKIKSAHIWLMVSSRPVYLI